jgi:cytochrome c-type biogenesis protein CcmH/NrfG
VSGWTALGGVYEDLKRYDDAVEAYRQVDKIFPDNASALWNLGHAYALSGNKTAAMDVVRKLRRLNRTDADKLFNLILPR